MFLSKNFVGLVLFFALNVGQSFADSNIAIHISDEANHASRMKNASTQVVFDPTVSADYNNSTTNCAPMAPFQATFALGDSVDVLSAVVAIIRKYQSDDSDYYAYERGQTWHVGLGHEASLTIDPTGSTSTISVGDLQETSVVEESLPNIARSFMAEYAKEGRKTFGYAGFNYASHIRGQTYKPGDWPLLSLLVPSVEVILNPQNVTIVGDESSAFELYALLKPVTNLASPTPQTPIDTLQNGNAYKTCVRGALDEIANGDYMKVIVSRAVDIPHEIDMPSTLLRGRRANTPARSFSLSHAGFEATGFSPELVMSLENGKVTTEPLAGTRSRLGTPEEIEARRRDLLSDPKEIVEHVLSVRHAIEELESQSLCRDGTVVTEELMAIRERGPVQHIGSRVVGSISPGKDGWDAFDVVFPSITASGIPKAPAMEGIHRLEKRPRELYSGAVLLIEGPEFFEATLVLRTVFQDQNKRWIQAGAGVLAMSKPERELTETIEKLASIAPFVVGKEN